MLADRNPEIGATLPADSSRTEADLFPQIDKRGESKANRLADSMETLLLFQTGDPEGTITLHRGTEKEATIPGKLIPR
jgi:hypothetical protein